MRGRVGRCADLATTNASDVLREAAAATDRRGRVHGDEPLARAGTVQLDSTMGSADASTTSSAQKSQPRQRWSA